MKTVTKKNNPVIAIVFWAYVIIPLAWGLSSTIQKAMALFN
ncbi:MAG: oxalate:formate antiporter [Herminiimonas sp.]|nr:oxalate:formate antiporter [Herminiimonas sp.]MDO9422460.1 oxalate:formate antiporter [Herminiimonas sp.]